MPKTHLHIELLSCSQGKEEIAALAAKLCYSKADIGTLKERVERNDQSTFISGVISSGHLSVVEHVQFTFGIEGVSRVLLAQLTRHRIASFSVQSQRYVSFEKGFNFIIPPKIEALGQEATDEFIRQMDTIHGWYKKWQELLVKGEEGNEDARFVLPNACETKLVLTMNARELLHFFSLRCCNRAQWEIHALADRMLVLCKEHAPLLFAKAGPGCVNGPCPEGNKTCGQIAQVRQKYLNHLK
ncbi:MAG TPA: FAD-dependent thymidylate synthase [Clostridiales bacterium]|mgnify:CR=1 FL=1|jgi:thymidylate synthase (FAD)|nr:FAD-dependent thymidylate synthase [Clostridiales bacterium]